MKLRISTAAFAALYLFIISGVIANNGVDIRFSSPIIDQETQTAYVDVQLRSTNQPLILAGQNYRVFYNTDLLALDETKSDIKLPEGKYSDLTFHNTMEEIEATGIGTLEFDDNLGFTNFSIDLIDQLSGGVTLENDDNWTTVATLSFNIKSDVDDLHLVWGREGVSHDYATAYVEMAEWIAPKKIQSLDINEYFDLEFSKESTELNEGLLSFEFGPNPSTEFINISFAQELSQDSELRFVNMKGQVAKRIDIDAGTPRVQVAVTDLSAGNYMIELSNDLNRIVAQNKLSVLK